MPSKNEIQEAIYSVQRRISDARKSGLDSLGVVKAHFDRARQIADRDGPKELKDIYNAQKSHLLQALDDFDTPSMGSEVTRMLTRDWDDPFWSDSTTGSGHYQPHFEGLAPGVIRIGELLIDQIRDAGTIPAMVPIRSMSSNTRSGYTGHLAIFSNSQETRQAAVSCLQTVAVRAISTFPARKLRGIFVDPIGMGNNFPFKSFPEFISGPKTFTRSDDIREQIRGLTVHIEQVIQKYLSSDYSTIEEFNAAKSFIKEPYRYVFVADFPSAFDNASLEDLKSLLTNGAKAGVYVVLHVDESLEKPRNFDYGVFDSYCTVVRATGQKVGETKSKPKRMVRPQKRYQILLNRFELSDAFQDALSDGSEILVEDNDEYLDPDDEDMAEAIAEIIGISFEEAANMVKSAYEQDVCIAENVEEPIALELTTTLADFDAETQLVQLDIAEEIIEQSELTDEIRDKYRDEPLFSLRLPQGQRFSVILDHTPSNDQINFLASSMTEAIRQVRVETVPYEELQPSEAEIWSFRSDTEVRTPIGVSGALDQIEFWLGQSEEEKIASQALLAGRPGAGKSYTLHAIVTNLAMRYSPDELEMYLLDFKEGVEFQIYVDPLRSDILNPLDELDESNALPHAKVISIDSDREFGLSVLKRIQGELEDRGRQFRTVGVPGLKEFREKRPDVRMPRVLIVIDEFQYMFLQNDDVTRELNVIFEDITRRGRAFGIHLLLATQSPNVPNMSRGIYSFIDLRMAQQMDKPTASAVLAEGNIDAVDLIERPGEIIYNANGGTSGHNVFGQVVDMSLAIRKKALMDIQSVATTKEFERPEPLILFNGLQATKLKRNPQLQRLTRMQEWLSLRELNKQIINDSEWMMEEFPGVAWLGEAMRIGNHTHAIFRRRSRNNMLMIGSSEETVFGMLGAAIMSLAHCYTPGDASFEIIDLSYPDEDNYWADLTLQLRDAIGGLFPMNIGKRAPDPEKEVSRYQTILQNVNKELERRKAMREEHPDEVNFGPSIFFICAIGGLNRAQTMRPVMGRRNEEPSEDGQALIDIVAQGAELGIHTISWFDNMKSFLKLSGDDRSWLTHFDLRVAMTMPAEDSRLLIRDTYAQDLPRLRAYFRDEATTAGLEKFKPYAVLTPEEINEYGNKLSSRSKR